jgi:hypothetical protein
MDSNQFDDAERDRQTVQRFRKLSNDAKLGFLDGCTADEATAILNAPIAQVNPFCRGIASERIENLASRAHAALVAARISGSRE